MKSFQLTIVNPEKVVFQGAVESLILPCAKGYLGVLADHAPLIANVVSGTIYFRKPGNAEAQIAYQGKGFLEVFHNQVSVLLSNAMIEGKRI